MPWLLSLPLDVPLTSSSSFGFLPLMLLVLVAVAGMLAVIFLLRRRGR